MVRRDVACRANKYFPLTFTYRASQSMWYPPMPNMPYQPYPYPHQMHPQMPYPQYQQPQPQFMHQWQQPQQQQYTPPQQQQPQPQQPQQQPPQPKQQQQPLLQEQVPHQHARPRIAPRPHNIAQNRQVARPMEVLKTPKYDGKDSWKAFKLKFERYIQVYDWTPWRVETTCVSVFKGKPANIMQCW